MTEPALLDPSADATCALAERSGLPEPLNKIYFRKLCSAVVDAGRCVGCGTCMAACPSRSIEIAEDGLPTLVRMCTGCSFCWDFCPRAGLRYERLWRLAEGHPSREPLGRVEAAYSARSVSPNPRAQDGGVVTALLEALLEAGEISGALVVRGLDPFRGEPLLARSVEDLRRASGSVYCQTMTLDRLKEGAALGIGEEDRLAVVGTPCEITGLRALQRYGWRFRRNRVGTARYLIALMCTRCFHPGRLVRMLKERGVDISKVAKMDVKENLLRLYDPAGAVVYEADVRRFRRATLKGCDECADFTGRLADISVGSVGSARGFSTALIRTEEGARAWRLAEERLERRPVDDLDAVRAVAERSRAKAARALKRRFDPEAPLWISYEAHLRDHAGTDRAPVEPASYRIHHFDITC